MARNDPKQQGIETPKSEWPGGPSASEEDEPPIDRLRPGSDLHNRVLKYLKDRLQDSERAMGQFYDRWQVNESKVQAYIDLPDWEQRLKEMNDSQGAPPQSYPIVVPYMYATVATIVTYLLHTFAGRRPMFQVGARKSESAQSSRNMETVLQYNADHTRMIKQLTDFLYGPQIYGVGILRNMWVNKKGTRTVIKEEPKYKSIPIIGTQMPTGETEKVKVKEERTIYQGNETFAWDPFMFFPDPRVPMADVNRRGEYVWFRSFEGKHQLKRDEAQGTYKWVDAASNEIPDPGNGGSSRNILAGGETNPTQQMSGGFKKSNAQIDQGTVWIIPAELGLGDRKEPQLWLFTIMNKSQIIQAEPLGADHDMHPCAVTEPYALGHGFGNAGMSDYIGPIQDQISWLINSHQDNVRKVLNDVLVVDPSKLEMQDLNTSEPGKLARLKRAAYGTDVRTAVQQLAVQDVTANHIQDAELFMRLGQQLSAVTENVLGMQSSGGRKTATEVRTTSEAAASRLAAQARIISAQAIVDLTEQMSLNIQQYMDEEFYLNLVGEEGKDNPIHITPEMVVGDFQYPVHDGTLPMDRVAMLDIWKELFQVAQGDEEIRQTYSLPKMFEWIAELGGAQNIESMQMADSGAMQQQAQAGNMITPEQAQQLLRERQGQGGAPTGAGGQGQAAGGPAPSVQAGQQGGRGNSGRQPQ